MTREQMQRELSAEIGVPYDPRWKSPHCNYGSCTCCDNPLCTHRCHRAAGPAVPAPGSSQEVIPDGALF